MNLKFSIGLCGREKEKRHFRTSCCNERGRHDSHATTSLVLLHDMRLTGEKRVLYDTVQ
jgi:hypothetical protein